MLMIFRPKRLIVFVMMLSRILPLKLRVTRVLSAKVPSVVPLSHLLRFPLVLSNMMLVV